MYIHSIGGDLNNLGDLCCPWTGAAAARPILLDGLKAHLIPFIDTHLVKHSSMHLIILSQSLVFSSLLWQSWFVGVWASALLHSEAGPVQ